MPEHSLYDNNSVAEVSTSHLSMQEVTNIVNRRARELVGELIKHRGHEKPPFLAEEYALLQGIKRIVKTDLGETDGLLLRLSEGYVIKLNATHSQVRQNFSCAHEIGHTFLDELEWEPSGDDPEFRMPSLNIGGRAKERLCHTAAVELLMPESVFGRYLSSFGVSAGSIEPLARIFGVSIPTAAIRISELSKEPCIAVKWKRWQKERSNGFYLEWPNNILKSKYVRNPSALLKAYENDSVVVSFKSFEINHIRKRCCMESKGFGQSNMRYVISIVFPERQRKVED